MFNGHSSNRNLSMGVCSSDGSTSLMRYKSQFPLETDRLSFNEGSFMDNSDWVNIIGSEDNGTNEIFGGQIDFPNNPFNEDETSVASLQTEAGCGQSKRTPAQRDRKRKADEIYRQKLEDKMKVLQGLVPGCSKVKGKEAMLDAIISYVQSLQGAVEVTQRNAKDIQMKADEGIAENILLKAENERLNAENTMLRKQIGLQPSSVKHLEHQSVCLQDHHAFISEAVDKDQRGTNSEAVDRLNSMEMNELQSTQEIVPVNATSSMSGGGFILPNSNLLQLETVSASKFSIFTTVGSMQGPQDISEVNGGKSVSGLEAQLNATEAPEANIHIRAQTGQTTIGHGLAGNVAGSETIFHYVKSLQRRNKFLEEKLAASRPISNSDEAISDILLKLEADDESKVKLPDFDGLDGERITIGKYSFPISLLPIVNKMIEVYGDVSATSKMNPTTAETIYIMFFASVKEMSEQRLEQVTEPLILKWRDVIKDALSINFKVNFAMEHLKKIARGYIGLTEHSKILKLEAQLSATKERSKVYMDAAEDFSGKPVSSGMLPDTQVS